MAVTQKLEDMVRRQSALTQKMIDKKATDDELAELKTLTAAIAEATKEEPAKVTSKTTLTVMTLGDFQKSSDEIMAGNPSPEQLALLKRNLAAIKDQGVTDAENNVAIEVMVELTAEDRIAQLEEKISQMESAGKDGFDARTQTGMAKPPEGEGGDGGEGEEGGEGEKPNTNKEGEDVAQQLGVEAIDALIARFTSLKQKIEAGTLKLEDVHDAWTGEWELRQMIEGAAAVLAKMEEAKSLIEEVTPKLKELDKDNDDEDENPEGGEGDKKEKGDFAWKTGDLAPTQKEAGEQYADIKKSAGKFIEKDEE